VYLRDSETRCWGLCAPLWGASIFTQQCGKQRRREYGEAGSITQPPRHVFPPAQPRFRRFRFRQSAQVKGSAEGSIFVRDKFWDTFARSADSQINAFLCRGPHWARAPQKRPVGAEAHPVGWGKHRVRLYAVRTRWGAAPAPPAPKGGQKCNSEKDTPGRICAAENKKEHLGRPRALLNLPANCTSVYKEKDTRRRLAAPKKYVSVLITLAVVSS